LYALTDYRAERIFLGIVALGCMPMKQQKIDVRQIVKALGTTNIIPIHWMTLPLTSLMRSMSLTEVKLESL
jgi:hypothetical protein